MDFVLKSVRCSKGDVWNALFDNFTKLIHVIVVGKGWVMKL